MEMTADVVQRSQYRLTLYHHGDHRLLDVQHVIIFSDDCSCELLSVQLLSGGPDDLVAASLVSGICSSRGTRRAWSDGSDRVRRCR
jgi:hypothetical protein